MNTKTISVTMWEGQAEILKKASSAVGLSLSEYIRSRLLPIAARDAGVPLPKFPAFEPRVGKGDVTLAAEAMGLSVEQFRQRMAERAARAILEELTQPVIRGSEPAPHESGTMPVPTFGQRRSG